MALPDGYTLSGTLPNGNYVITGPDGSQHVSAPNYAGSPENWVAYSSQTMGESQPISAVNSDGSPSSGNNSSGYNAQTTGQQQAASLLPQSGAGTGDNAPAQFVNGAATEPLGGSASQMNSGGGSASASGGNPTQGPYSGLGDLGSLLKGFLGGGTSGGNTFATANGPISTVKPSAALVNQIGQPAALASTANNAAKLSTQDLQTNQTNAIGGLNTGYSAATQALSPYAQAGTAGLTQLQNLLGTNGTQAQQQAISSVQANPSYQFGLNQGLQGTQAQLAAQGLSQGGVLDKAMTQYGTNYANQAIQNQVSNLTSLASAGANASGALANAATQYGNNTANTYTQTGTNLANTQQSLGNALLQTQAAAQQQQNQYLSLLPAGSNINTNNLSSSVLSALQSQYGSLFNF